jgi:hypothetical protein
MKKLIAISFLFALTLTASAQYGIPRFGTDGHHDNTDRVFNNMLVSKADAAGADTVFLNPVAASTYVTSTLTDSICYNLSTVATTYNYDELFFTFVNGTGTHKVKVTNKSLATPKPFVFAVAAGDSVTSLTTGQRMYMSFMFDGSKWIETSKVVK